MPNTQSKKHQFRRKLIRRANLVLANTLRMPRMPAIKVTKKIGKIIYPFELKKRKLDESTIPHIKIDENLGFLFVQSGAIPEIMPAVQQAHQLYTQCKDSGLEKYHQGASRKNFLVYATQNANSSRYEHLMRLALSRSLIDAVAVYLGSIPVLSNVSVMVSLPNDTQEDSQLYHLDFEDERQIKVFINVGEVCENSGPFTLLPADLSEYVRQELKYTRGRLSIESVESVISKNSQIRAVGPSGQALFVDTSRCLHYGSNRNRKTRVLILIQYIDYYAPEAQPTQWPVESLSVTLGLDRVQTLALMS